MVCNIKGIIRQADIFGQGIQLRINNQDKPHTLFGGLLTIIMVLILVSSFCWNMHTVITRKIPYVTIEPQILDSTPVIKLDKYTMPLAFSLTGNTNRAVIKPNYFKFSATMLHVVDSEQHGRKEFNMVYCKKEFFPLISQNEYDYLGMEKYLCIEDMNIDIYGQWVDYEISYLEVRVSQCVNLTETDNCAPKEEIEEFLLSESYFFNVYYMNTVINTQNATTPVTYNIINYFKAIELDSTKCISIYIQEKALISDDGYFLEDKNKIETIGWEESTYDELIKINNDMVIFDFYSSSKKIIFHRSYSKIQNVLAGIGGIANMLRIAFILCCLIFSNVRRDEIILNKIFDYDIGKSNEGKVIDFKKKPKLIKQIFMNMKNRNKNKAANENSCSLPEILKKNNSKLPSKINLQKKNKIFVKQLNNQEQVKIGLNEYTPNMSENSKYHRFENEASNRTFNSIVPNNLNNYMIYQKSQDQPSTTNTNSFLNAIRNKIKDKSVSDDNSNPERLTKHENTDLKVSDNAQDQKKKDAKEIINLLNSQNKTYQLRFSFSEILRAFLCCECCMNPFLKTKKALYNKSNIAIQQYLDITFLIQKLEEFEKLKIILLNNERLALFNFIAKEIMSLDEEKIQNHDMSKYLKLNKNREHLANIIINFRDKMNSNMEVKEIDKKLFMFLDEIFK